MSEFADVAVPVGVRKTFAYKVPDRLRAGIAPGVRVLVPFGRKLVTGFVVGVGDAAPAGDFRLREIRDVLDVRPLVPPPVVDAALWTARYYFAPPGETLRGAIPPGTLATGAVTIRLTERAARLMEGGLRPPGVSPAETRILEALQRGGAAGSDELGRRSGVSDAARRVSDLAASGWVAIEEELRAARVTEKELLGVRALPAAPGALEALPKRQREVYCKLDASGRVHPLQALVQSAGVSASSLRTLAAKGFAEIAPMSVERRPLDLAEAAERKEVSLTQAQQRAFDELRVSLDSAGARRFLLHGVTGSGKTEVYLRLIGEVLRRGESALLLVPEIGLTPLLSRIALSHFPDRVGLLHSGLSSGERFDQWQRIRGGGAPVVVGTRSAVFAPVDRLRLIVLDEEHDASYKQEESPCYHAREVAWHRISRAGGVLLLGSATPSVETFSAARERGEIGYLPLPERIHARPLPEVTVVDMSLEFQRYGKRAVLSETLRKELAERLERGEQAIVLLNRRGYARSMLCRSCGHVLQCADCSVAMTYHRGDAAMICHYCGVERGIPESCASCGGPYIHYTGVGTEQLEEIIRADFPRCRVARVDRDSTKRRGALRRMLLAFSRGELDLLIGTQILAKGHDFPNVTLVGVVAADAGLAFPDFRAAERTFQLLTQVAGRAGRGAIPGKVVIQSFYPEHYALRFAREQDYEGFFRHEKEFRSLMRYPPAGRLIQIVVANTDEGRGLRIAEKIADALRERLRRARTDGVRVLGPAAAPIEKLRGSYRFQLLVKYDLDADAHPALDAAFADLAARKVSLRNVRVDVDPLSLL
jgi:primosomal protein N' (replication factor Y)